MVATTLDYTQSRYRAAGDGAFDGVVRLSVAGLAGTGTLLYDGITILTAAHLFANGTTGVRVMFDTAAGAQTLQASRVRLHPQYDPRSSNNDLALVTLAMAAPVTANRHELYRERDEVGQRFDLVGYGTPGTGTSGRDTSYSGPPLRLAAANVADADIGQLAAFNNTILARNPVSGSQFVADFDDGSAARDAFAVLAGIAGTGLGADEGFITSGDSGGPALIGARVAGVASYSGSLSSGGVRPDSDGTVNSTFGEIGAWQRVSAFQQFIDAAIREDQLAAGAPRTPAEVQRSVAEGNSGIRMAWFLVGFSGERTTPDQVVSVAYRTLDGTATAGEDYLPVSGRLNLYPGEAYVPVGVELIGDTRAEGNETLLLEIFDPVGGGFDGGAVTLTAIRTIVDDDLGPPG
jgi:hypothetical protein